MEMLSHSGTWKYEGRLIKMRVYSKQIIAVKRWGLDNE